jgi:hypothetical protein
MAAQVAGIFSTSQRRRRAQLAAVPADHTCGQCGNSSHPPACKVATVRSNPPLKFTVWLRSAVKRQAAAGSAAPGMLAWCSCSCALGHSMASLPLAPQQLLRRAYCNASS